MNSEFRRSLKAKAHHLKPVVLIGAKGLTQAVTEETEVALNAHELIKVKIYGVEREDRQSLALTLCQDLQADLVQLIGNTAILYRKRKD